MAEFDPHADIRKLAEADIDNIAPFASLRLEKQGPWSHRDCKALGSCDLALAPGAMLRGATDCGGRGWISETDVEKACWQIIHILYHKTKAHNISHMDFGMSSYPFVRRGETALVAFTQGAYVGGEWDQKNMVKAYGNSFEEALIRAALDWVEEQHGPKLAES